MPKYLLVCAGRIIGSEYEVLGEALNSAQVSAKYQKGKEVLVLREEAAFIAHEETRIRMTKIDSEGQEEDYYYEG